MLQVEVVGFESKWKAKNLFVLIFTEIAAVKQDLFSRGGLREGDDLEHGACPQRGRREEREYSQDALSDGQSLG